MAGSNCPTCGGPRMSGFVVTTNGSGLFWSHEERDTRFRPKGLEVLVGTGVTGTFSANLPGLRCPKCKTILLTLPPGK
ncbi:MAG TPA: PF20097 family protein [Thermoplasmata archaeon]|nr:PF20097 family protein [Thermoplasmata archaeon]